jgi:H+-transporting ATPase
MIWIAAITEAAISNFPDMAILLAIQFINAGLGFYEIVKAGDAVAALKKSLKPLATAKRDGKWSNIDAGTVVPGDLVLLASGSAIPADCIVNEGTIEVDQSALTGESLPVTMYKGSSCKMGSNVVRGEVEGTVEFTGSNTFFGKTASLLQGDDELGNLQKVLLKIVIVLVILSFTFSGVVFGFLLGSGQSLTESISFTVVLIIASIPVAIEIVCTTTLCFGLQGVVQARSHRDPSGRDRGYGGHDHVVFRQDWYFDDEQDGYSRRDSCVHSWRDTVLHPQVCRHGCQVARAPERRPGHDDFGSG